MEHRYGLEGGSGMTDSERIARARKCVSEEPECRKCPWFIDSDMDASICMGDIVNELLGVVDRQSAEIERLQERVAIQAADLKKGAE